MCRCTDEALRGLMVYDDIAFCRRPDGKLWLLGAGTHGKVRPQACRCPPRALKGFSTRV